MALSDRLKPNIASAVNLVGSSIVPRQDNKRNKLEALRTDEALGRLAGSIESNKLGEEVQQNKLSAQKLLEDLNNLNINV